MQSENTLKFSAGAALDDADFVEHIQSKKTVSNNYLLSSSVDAY